MNHMGYPDRIGRLSSVALGGYTALILAYVLWTVEWCRQWGFPDPDAVFLYVGSSVLLLFLVLSIALQKKCIRWARVLPGVVLPSTLILYIIIRRSVVLTGRLTSVESVGLFVPAALLSLALLLSFMAKSKPDRPRWRLMPVGFVLTAGWVVFVLWMAPLEDQIWFWLGGAAVHYVVLMADAPDRFWFALMMAIPTLVLTTEFRGAFPLQLEGEPWELVRPPSHHEHYLQALPEKPDFYVPNHLQKK